MTNNDILRRLRYTFSLSDDQMMEVFKMADYRASRAMVSDWLKKEEDEDFQPIDDLLLATFLNGFITKNRGKKDGPSPKPERYLSNNDILRKLKIALSLQSGDMLQIFKLVDTRLSEHELSAFLRNPKQNQFRKMNDQYLRNFLHGLQLKYRPK